MLEEARVPGLCRTHTRGTAARPQTCQHLREVGCTNSSVTEFIYNGSYPCVYSTLVPACLVYSYWCV